jgi:hypothetical protein
MADLDYTNIAGSAFQPYVDTQIKKRKALVNKDYRSSSELNWLSNRNVWIRISSGANISPGNKRYQGLEGDELSKKYILQGGVLNHLEGADSYTLRSGVGPDGAYGIGGTDFGLVPMPGLIDISIKTGGKLGTLKETTFNFVCHNMEQLNIMEALYMKLGFGVLVEWGHTYYIDNDTESIQSNPLPLPFYGIKTKEDLMEKITTQRKKYSGNYDATWGTVKNFSYTLDGNGRFKCQVQLVGAGDILESLKVNLSGEFESDTSGSNASGSIYPVVSDANLSLLNSALFNIYQNDVIHSDNIETSFIDFNDLYKSWLDSIFGIDNISISNWPKNPELIKKGYNFRLINTPGMDAPHTSNIDSIVPEIIPGKFFPRLIAGYDIDGAGLNENDDTKPGLEQVYITLGHLLLLINKLGMIYERKEDAINSTNQKPYIYIDVNPDTNRCYTFPGHCSLDPTICLIGSQQLPFGITSPYFDNIKSYFPFYGNNSNAPGIGDADLGGKFMYTLVNINYVASLMKKWRATNTKGDVYFIDLVKDILDGISKATGGYNEFRIVPDDDTQCIRILDDRRTGAEGTIPDYTEIPVLGKKSIVYNFDYTSKIAPNTAAMIVVAAQAQPYGVQGAENALAFSHLNKGLYNRLGTVRVDAANDLNKTVNTNNNTEQRYIELRDFIEKIYDAVGTGALSESETEQPVVTQQNVLGDDLPPVFVKVNKDTFKDKFRSSLEAAISELKIIAQNSKEDVSKEVAALDNAKAAILNSSTINDFETYKTLYQFNSRDLAEIDIPKSSMYAYVTFRLNSGYDSPSPWYNDSNIEKLWQEKLDALNGNQQKSDFK